MNVFKEASKNFGVCGKCGALPREVCRDLKGWATYPHADRFIIGWRLRLGKKRR